MSSKQMKRGKIQSLYRYLPEEWIDFSVRGDEREQFIAKVIRWNTEKLVGINAARLLRTVNDAAQDFEKNGAELQGFGDELNTKNCDILVPRVSDEERGIVASVSPLVFYCKKCYRVHKFKSFEDYSKHRYCKNCRGKLAQFRQIFFCKCGHASDVYPTCREHGDSDLRWDKNYNFICNICKKKIPLIQTCSSCKTNKLGPKVALDPSQFFPFSLSLIDLIDEKLENFVDSTDYGRLMVIAYWLGLIDKNTLEDVIKNGIVTDPEDYQKEYDKFFNMFKPLGEESAKAAATLSAQNKCGSQYLEIVEKVKVMTDNSEVDLRIISEQLLEYKMVAGLDTVVTIEDAVKIAESLNTNANPEEYIELSKKFGISHVVACDEIPFVSCTYGYTRVESEPKEGVVLKALKQLNNGRKNVLASKTRTEGVLFEFDRKRIIEWLLRNSFISEADAPSDYSEQELKMWFINNIKPTLISRFSNINQVSSEITYYVYRLIHSISHSLIRAAGELSGLGKDSLSEYIFPGVPAVLIYCQNSQGFNLGSLAHTFEAYYDRWLNLANKLAKKCVFDPICIEIHKACTGCLYLNEISCEHFNKDLDRSLIIGHSNIETQNRLFGFWEEE